MGKTGATSSSTDPGIVLALDLGVKSGYACNSTPQWKAGEIDCSDCRSIGARLYHFRVHLKSLIISFRPCLVCYEAVRGFGYHHTLVSLARFSGIVEEQCYVHGIPVKTFTSTAIKKHATGSGRALKKELIDKARSRWPHLEVVSEHVADALFLLDLVLCRSYNTPSES